MIYLPHRRQHFRALTPSILGVVGHWQFEEASYNETPGEMKDSSGQGNHGEGFNGLTTTASGYRGRALLGDADSYGEVPHNTSLDFSGPFTIACWMYLNAKTSNQHLINKHDITINSGWRLSVGTDEFYFTLFDSLGNSYQVSPNVTVNAETWYFLCGRYDGTYQSLWVGNTEYEKTNIGSKTIKVNTEPVRIGRLYPFISYGYSLVGRLDDCAIWGRALSDGEVADFKTNGITYS